MILPPDLLIGRAPVDTGAVRRGGLILLRAPFVDMVLATSCHREGMN